MSSPLPYDVLYCTSEDPQHPVSQLAGGAAASRSQEEPLTGWQSARNGKVPQTLVLRFPGNVWLQQLRILSHESKIATKVEVRVAKLADEDDWTNPPSFRNMRFVKLGSVDFNSNEQSHYRSKERKTVHLKTEAYFLKLLFDRPYINAFNAGQQIGLYSLECSGHVVQAVAEHADDETVVGGSSRRGSFASKPASDKRGAHPSATGSPSPPPPRPVAPPETGHGASLRQPLRSAFSSNGGGPPQGAAGVAFRSVRILEFEDFFLRRSEELVSLKEEAVAVEDFAAAAECRDKLALLNSGAREVYELEQDKVQAIIDENFEAAQQVKVRMNDLVGRLFAQTALPVPGGAASASPGSVAPSEASDTDGAAPREGDHQPRSVPAEAPPSLDGSEWEAAPRQPDTQSVASEAIAATEAAERVVDAQDLQGPERSVARAILSCAGGGEDSVVALTNPGFDIQPLVAAVGSFACACLLSRRFKLREAALVVLTDHLDMFTAAPAVVEDAVLRFLDHNAYGLQDAIPNVVFAACTFARMVLADASGCISLVLSPLVALVPRLLTRCSDNLQRVRDEALATLTLYVKTSAISATALVSATLMEPADKDRRKLPFTNAKAQLSRLTLFQLAADNGRVHLEGNTALSENVLQKLLLPTVNHPNPEVRDLAAAILGKLAAARQIVLRERDLAKITNTGIRDAIAAKRT